jgi:hypothetical protein
VVTGAAAAARQREVGNSVARSPSSLSSRAADFAGEGARGGVAEATSPTAALGLPGVPIDSVGWTEVVPGQPAIRVAQHLADGTPLRLWFVGVQAAADATAAAETRRAEAGLDSPVVAAPLPAAPPPAAVGSAAGRAALPSEASSAPATVVTLLQSPLPDGWRQLARPFRGGWVLIRAPLPEARLLRMLEELGAGAPS